MNNNKKYISKAKKSIIFMLILAFFMINSCEKKENWQLKNSKEQFLVVDGILTNEHKNQTIKLSLSYSDLNGSENSISGASVSVSGDNKTYSFHKDTGNDGVYISDNKFSGVVNETYTLTINYKNKEYKANANMIPVAISNPLPYKQIQGENMFYIVADVASFNPDVSSMYEVTLDWSEISGYEDLPVSETTARMFFYNLTTIDVNQIFSSNNETILFPQGTKMTQIKYSLSPQHEEFIRSLLIETQWHGGFFDIEEGNVYTNITGGAYGFFGACSVVSRSSVVN